MRFFQNCLLICYTSITVASIGTIALTLPVRDIALILEGRAIALTLPIRDIDLKAVER